MILDGSMGEGGGQILRTALALSSVTGTPVRIGNVRAGRRRPGLARQHLTAVRGAAAVVGAALEGDALGSTEVVFRPREVRPGEYRFSTGGAGSAILVLQTLLPPLLRTSSPSGLVLEGGTHNPFAPPFDFLRGAFVPLLGRMGAGVEVTLERPGFHPAGGGRLRVRIEPPARLRPLTLVGRGPVLERRARAVVSALPRSIAERELHTVGELLGVEREAREVVVVEEPVGPGNVVLVEIVCREVTEVFTGFGQKGVLAEDVARGVADEVGRWERAEVAVGPHLADQLLLPLALAGGGSFTTVEPTSHARTNADVIGRFLDDVEVTFRLLEGERWRVEVET